MEMATATTLTQNYESTIKIPWIHNEEYELANLKCQGIYWEQKR